MSTKPTRKRAPSRSKTQTSASVPPTLPPLEPRKMELIGLSDDGCLLLWQVGMVLPISEFEIDRYGHIRSDHYVIAWKGHAITVHLSSRADGDIAVQIMCSGGTVFAMHRDVVESLLLGRVMPDPKHEAEMQRLFKKCFDSLDRAASAPHRQRGPIDDAKGGGA